MPAKVYEKVAPVTVKIFCDRGRKIGSGVIIGLTDKGRALILTACHVVASNFEETDPDIGLELYKDIVIKTTTDVKLVRAGVIQGFVDRSNDLTLLATVEPVLIDKVIQYSLTNKVKPGEKVAAFGYPARDKLSQTVGRITRLESKYLVFDAKIRPGNSGGALVDKNGRMLGISTFVENETEGYALNMSLVLPIVEEWLRGIKLNKQWKLEKDNFPLWPVIGGGVALGVGGVLLWPRNGSTATPNVFPFPIRPTRN
ncbi:MAG: S1 family peptidase [bacterium]